MQILILSPGERCRGGLNPDPTPALKWFGQSFHKETTKSKIIKRLFSYHKFIFAYKYITLHTNQKVKVDQHRHWNYTYAHKKVTSDVKQLPICNWILKKKEKTKKKENALHIRQKGSSILGTIMNQPAGVPVAMMSPGWRVIAAEITSISSGIPNIICEVRPSCADQSQINPKEYNL